MVAILLRSSWSSPKWILRFESDKDCDIGFGNHHHSNPRCRRNIHICCNIAPPDLELHIVHHRRILATTQRIAYLDHRNHNITKTTITNTAQIDLHCDLSFVNKRFWLIKQWKCEPKAKKKRKKEWEMGSLSRSPQKGTNLSTYLIEFIRDHHNDDYK